MHDVAVVGGGPGGLHAARLLARSGFDVAVFEEHPTSGDPVHCTGILAAEAFGEFDLARDTILNDLRTARFVAPSGHAISHTTDGVEAVAVDRLAFDRQLFEAAAREGASLVAGTRVTSVEADAREVRLLLGNGRTVRSRTCVLACGANYRLQQRLGMGLPSVFLQSAQMELPLSGRSSGEVEVHVGRTVAPSGFAWVVPVRRGSGWCVRIGLMCERDAVRHFRRFVARLQERLGIETGSVAALRPRGKMLPLAPIARTYARRVLAIGDAAGIVKATTGGGIYYSLVSAGAACQVLAASLRRDTLDTDSLARFERLWKSRLGAEIEAQLELRAIAHRMSDHDIEALFELARTDGIMPIVRRTARFNHHRALIRAVFRHPPARRLLFDRLRGRGGRQLHAAGD